jgi:hypothetical protein
VSTVERNVGIAFLWLAVFVIAGIGSCSAMRLEKENQDLKSALIRSEERQDRLNTNLRDLAHETEQQLTRHEQEIQGINSRVKTFQATRDPESGAIVWDESPASE